MSLHNIIDEEANMDNAMAKLYRHIFSGGTIDQIDHEFMIILILNPPVKKGVVKRKSYGTLYARHLVYLNTITGSAEIVNPSHWSNLDPSEIQDAMNKGGVV